MLCDVCRNIFTNFQGFTKESQYGSHHTTFLSFAQSVQCRCYVCAKLWRKVLMDGQVDLESFRNDFKKTCYILDGGPDSSETKGIPILIIFVHGRSKLVDEKAIAFVISTESVVGAKLIDITPNLDSDANFLLMTKWLKTCTTQHKTCGKYSNMTNFIPTRLVDVGTSNLASKIYIVHKSNLRNIVYMTLSHCWGSASILKLTTSTQQLLETGINESDLPKTFKDAVQVVRRLRVRYLWIDSLCIRQDDVEEWLREASMMKDIYRSSLCNLAATGASNSDEGMFVARDPFWIQSCRTDLSWIANPNPTTITLIDNDFWEEAVTVAPLNLRGWVIQERLLAPRVLHFGKEQLLWECHELAACETYPDGNPPHPNSRGFKCLDAIIQDDSKKANDELTAYDRWETIVFHYRRCNLTKENDKLIAISGIAKEFQQLLSDNYLAGMWRRVLPSQLLWRVDNCEMGNGMASQRPCFYRAPSWSWASIEGWGRMGLTIGDILIKIRDAEVSPVTEDITGQIADGYIRLQGSLVAVELQPGPGSGFGRHSPYICIGTVPLSYDARVFPDATPDDVRGTFFCLPIDSDFHHGKHWVEGLCLQSSGEHKGQYKRYGTFVVSGEDTQHFRTPGVDAHFNPDHYEDKNERTIVLV